MGDSYDSSDTEHWGMKQPPLVKQLRDILDQYPNNGQIIKELIQNAEDAGATCIKILYDKRRLNQGTPGAKFYNKFFQGPALCFYNNATFSEGDWTGIRMISSSSKQEDPLKVGRFGLGFKSVFHLTDVVCVISGKKILFIDPHQKEEERVCISKKLSKLDCSKRLDKRAVLSALDGAFGFSEETFIHGDFPGTLFWFPLRQEASSLSDLVYKGSEIDQLLLSFTKEASSCILFLSHIENIELCRKTDSAAGQIQPIFNISSEQESPSDGLSCKSFLASIRCLEGRISEKSIQSISRLVIITSESPKAERWLVVRYFKGRPMTEELASLIRDERLSYSPLVGVATCISQGDIEVNGHVFCFLPLPIPEDQQRESSTKLPFHVNGFFALSQNRAQLKWPTIDQMNDKASMWNRCLIMEAVPEAYLLLLDTLISQFQASSDKNACVEQIYRCIPDINRVRDKWSLLVKSFIPSLIRKTFIYTEANGGRLLSPNDAIFATFEDLYLPTEVQESVRNVMKAYNMNLAVVPPHVIAIVKKEGLLTEITPRKLAEVFRGRPQIYQRFPSRDKINFLRYLMMINNLQDLDQLELLPLENRSFATFSKYNSPVYLVTRPEADLLYCLGEKLICFTELPADVGQKLSTAMEIGLFQLETMGMHSFAMLLKETIAKSLGTSTPIRRVLPWQKDWLKKIWQYIFSRFSSNLSTFQNMPFVPIEKGKDVWHLHCLCEKIVVKETAGLHLPDGVGRALETMGVIITESLPSWLNKLMSLRLIYNPSKNDIIKLLGSLPSTAADWFNSTCHETDREELVRFLGNGQIFPLNNAVSFLRRCRLFHKQSGNTAASSLSSLEELNQMLKDAKFPIAYPRPFLVCNPNSAEKTLAVNLGAEMVSKMELVFMTLTAFQSSYSNAEKIILMKHFLSSIHLYDTNREVLDLAKEVKFVKVNGKMEQPMNAFDPTDPFANKLFAEEQKFPEDPDFHREPYLSGLRKLGLSSTDTLDDETLFRTAKKLDEMSRAGRRDAVVEGKATAFLQALEMYISRFGSTDLDLSSFQCILPRFTRDKRYPEDLPWFKPCDHLCYPADVTSAKFSVLIGSVKAVVECDDYPNVSRHFSWTRNVQVEDILYHFQALQQSSATVRKSHLVFVIDLIYKDLASRSHHTVSEGIRKVFAVSPETARFILCNGTFVEPGNIFIDNGPYMVSLEPYFFKLPKEFKEYGRLFSELGCHEDVTPDVLLSVLEKMKQKHDISNASKSDIKKDVSIAVSILNEIRENLEDFDGFFDRILFPIHPGSSDLLSFRAARECTYCDAQWLRDFEDSEQESEFLYVHEDVSNITAEALGVVSLRQQLLTDAEAFEEWGQHEPLTVRLKSLLEEGYVDGMSVPKEIFQNADDAGASELCFVYDERENLDARSKLLDDKMAEFQGPALWAYNNSIFTEQDLINIQKLNAGTKKEDTAKIGKFGLGFCAVYNLTDVPSFISGNQLVIFDPHMKYLGKALQGNRPGIKVNLSKVKNQMMVKRMKNQFKPFQSMFGCDIDNANPFDGTLFRFPLRTASQAESSEIKNLAYNRKECQELFQMFVESAANLLLFSQNIVSIKLFHLKKSALDLNLVYTATKNNASTSPHGELKDKGMLQKATMLKKKQSFLTNPLRENERISIKVHLKRNDIVATKPTESKSEWLVSWATSTDPKTLQLAADKTGVVPLASTAALIELNQDEICPVELSRSPFGFYKTGHVFAFLPLPIQTRLNVHLNGCLAVTSDRRKLISQTEDDKSAGDNWNTALIEGPLCISLLQALEAFQKQDKIIARQYEYHAFWPIDIGEDFLALEHSFYKTLGAYPDAFKVFEANGKWLSLEKCMFLDAEIQDRPSVGEIAYQFLLHLQDRPPFAVKLPSKVADQFRKVGATCIQERTLSVEDFFIDNFLPNINSVYWSEGREDERNQLLVFAIELNNSSVNESLRVLPCIPSRPNGRLRAPYELVHPESFCGRLFSEDDGRFPEQQYFCIDEVLHGLVNLGMLEHELPQELVINRAESVQCMGNHCVECSVERCNNLLLYLNQSGWEKLDCKNRETLKNTAFLPVMEKIHEWIFPWKGETLDVFFSDGSCSSTGHGLRQILRLAAPTALYCKRWQHLVSCTELILDESVLLSQWEMPFELYKKLGLKQITDESSVDAILKQLKHFTATVKEKGKVDCSHVTTLFQKLYSYLDSMCAKQPETEFPLRKLSSEKILFIDGNLVSPAEVALELKHDCSPDLFKPGSELKSCSFLLKRIGVKDEFDPEVLVSLLEKKKNIYQMTKLPDNAIRQICNVILVLTDSLEKRKMDFNDMKRLRLHSIYAPDEEGVLRKTTDMCLADSRAYSGKRKLYFIHPHIPETSAQILGALTTARRSLKDNSRKIPFGQKERLVTRLQGLLKDYPCDGGIMKELIQNADDAKATEIHFIKDYRTHKSEKVLDESFEPLQGPALCVFNNAAFTEDDLEGIQNLGIGSKSEDATKTGQFGIGFNAVYNLTNAPSFLTKGPGIQNNETLCFFDPLCKYIPDIEENDPGVRYLDLLELRQANEDVFLGYSEDELLKNVDEGTVFRLPLRTEPCELSHHVTTTYELDRLFKHLENELFDMLLFVKNITEIKVSSITNGKLVEEYSVNVTITPENRDKRDEFQNEVSEFARQHANQRTDCLTRDCKQSGYEIAIEDTKGNCKSWFVSQQIGFDKSDNIPDSVQCALADGEIGLLPHGGVALLISDRTSNFTGSAFCFLPLPIKTGLPVHIHGHFALDHARRELWKNDDTFRTLWNKCLIENVIAPAYVAALRYCVASLSLGKINENAVVKKRKEELESHFPLIESNASSNWKLLADCFYQSIANACEKMFIIVTPARQMFSLTKLNTLEEKGFTVSWTALKESDGSFPAYFWRSDWEDSMVYILQTLGMKLTFTSKKIQRAIEASGVEAPSLSPARVIQFLKTHRSSRPDKCNLIGLGKPVEETSFNCIDNVRLIARYCFEKLKESTDFTSLPLVVTNDGVLREISKDIFLSRYCDLLPDCCPSFVHKDLTEDSIYIILESLKVFKSFAVGDFLQLLPSCLTYIDLRNDSPVEWMPEGNGIPNKVWLKRVWQFISGTVGEQEEEEEKEEEKFQQKCHDAVAQLGGWSLIPSIQNQLHHVSKLYTFLDVTSFQRGSCLASALKKIDLPQIDVSCLPENVPIVKYICECIPANQRPMDVLTCLRFHKNALSKRKLSGYEANSILQYFSDNLEEIKKHSEEYWIKDALKSLPIFVTQQNTLVSVEQNISVVILPCGVPVDGIDYWARNVGKIVLAQSMQLSKIHAYLEFGGQDEFTFFLENVLTLAREMTTELFMKLLNYMRKFTLRSRSFHSKETKLTQNRLINVLKETPLIRVNNAVMRCCDLKSPFNPVFAAMCSPEEFPPECYNENIGLLMFLEKLGLTNKVTGDLYVQYARSIEAEGSSLHESLKKKSDILVRSLLSEDKDSLSTECVNELSRIKFVVPAEVGTRFSNIFPQLDGAARLICFNGSVSFEKGKYFWTRVNLLPQLTIPEWLFQNLQVCASPQTEQVILHCLNLGHALKEKLPGLVQSGQDLGWITKHMDGLYEKLQIHVQKMSPSQQSNFKTRLQNSPIIYFPDTNSFLSANMTVISCLKDQEIPPYLRKIDGYFTRYKDLFMTLGTSDETCLAHYVHVLGRLKQQSEDGELIPSDLEPMQKAVKNIFDILKKQNNFDQEEQSQLESWPMQLFLPNRQRILVDAKLIVVSDSAFFEDLVQQNAPQNYFIDTTELGISCVEDLKKLPSQYRPLFLTEITRRMIDLGSEEPFHTAATVALENFLHSNELLVGVMRLLSVNRSIMAGDDLKETVISERFRQIKVLELRELKSYRQMKKTDGSSMRIAGSERDADFHVDFDSLTIYIRPPVADQTDLSWVRKHEIDLTHLIQENLNHPIRFEQLYPLFEFITNPDKIESYLDRMEIPQYTSRGPVCFDLFPKPGTFVPSRFHPFLDNEFSRFEPYEYQAIAMEVDDPGLEDDADPDVLQIDPTYIYVRIIESVRSETDESPLFQMYLVNTGAAERITVPAYRLYRFLRRTNTVLDVSVINDAPAPGVSVSDPNDVVFHQIRRHLRECWTRGESEKRLIIKRLWLKWHPDRNPGREEYCSDVFKYLQQCIVRLEEGFPLDDDDVDGANQGPQGADFMSSGYGTFCKRVWNRGQVYQQQSQSFYEEQPHYQQAGFPPAQPSHRESASVPYPYPREGKRWMRQAQADLQDATLALAAPLSTAYNWVCYRAHQAAEKALKSAWFYKDANKLSRRGGRQSHDLKQIADGLDAQVIQLASRLVGITGEHTRMRYPDAHYVEAQIPADAFTKTDAEQVVKIATDLLSLISDLFT